MELDWVGGHIDTDSLDSYISPTSGAVYVGVSVNKDFVPIFVFKNSKSFVEFIEQLINILETKKLQMANPEVPEVFKKAFNYDHGLR